MIETFLAWKTLGFGQPWWLLLIPVLVLVWRRAKQPAPAPAIVFSSLRLLPGLVRPVPVISPSHWRWLRLLAGVLVIIALARPRVEKGAEEEDSDGIDIMLVLDASRSMDSKDFDFDGAKVSRSAALERVIGDFIAERRRDRIGIIGFAERPFLICPLTLDHSWMMESLRATKTSLGTAIGSGIEAAVDLLRQTEGRHRAIIVVTDGLNTSGVDPLQAARLARRFGMRIYTIGVVSYQGMKTTGVDGLMLQQTARITGGQFFQAANGASLESVYQQIDQMERQAFRQDRLRTYRELFAWVAGAAFLVVVAELVAGFGRRMRIP